MISAVIFPHQLFAHNPILNNVKRVYVVEEPLLFSRVKFHKQKIVLHRASLKYYAKLLETRGFNVRYVEFHEIETTAGLAEILQNDKVSEVVYNDVTDDWLKTRFRHSCENLNIKLTKFETPMFFNSAATLANSFPTKKHYSLTDFYRKERLRLGILLDNDGKPLGGKWTFDADNRKKLPKNIYVPSVKFPVQNEFTTEAIGYVNLHFPMNYGEAEDFIYPTTHAAAEVWLAEFLAERFSLFGDYEDAISQNETFIFHSILTPMLNIGLLTPPQIVDKALSFADENNVSLNSLEGFIRQIIGWREFMRAVYEKEGRTQRTSNFWNHNRKLPANFWRATTDIKPLDVVIKRVIKFGYCHHIERLMILGNFMVLTEVSPDDVYLWFMEMFVDAYDWVMVPNVYAMSQYADGGLMTTKPYISGSNYIKKMSDFGEGDWCEIWDALYWRFIAKHEKFFRGNPRLSVMALALRKMDAGRKERLLNTAENYLENFK